MAPKRMNHHLSDTTLAGSRFKRWSGPHPPRVDGESGWLANRASTHGQDPIRLARMVNQVAGSALWPEQFATFFTHVPSTWGSADSHLLAV